LIFAIEEFAQTRAALASTGAHRPRSWRTRHVPSSSRDNRSHGFPADRQESIATIHAAIDAGIAYGLNRALGVPHNVACPSALIGASNFFELAVAAAIALFGFQSGAALATVVGVLVEVPVMLSVVRIVLRTRGWYEHRNRAFTA